MLHPQQSSLPGVSPKLYSGPRQTLQERKWFFETAQPHAVLGWSHISAQWGHLTLKVKWQTFLFVVVVFPQPKVAILVHGALICENPL